jgi:hypothetical protein
MRNLLLAFMAFGAAGAAVLSPIPADAQVTIRVPGVAVDTGPSWRNQRDAEWRDRRQFREPEHRRVEWRHDHCVRDWRGSEFCR